MPPQKKKRSPLCSSKQEKNSPSNESKGHHIEYEETKVESGGRWLVVVVIYEDDS